MTKKCLFVSCGGRRILNVFLLLPFIISSFYFFPLSNFSLYNIGCNVLKMKSYENLMQNIRLLQKEVLLLHLI